MHVGLTYEAKAAESDNLQVLYDDHSLLLLKHSNVLTS